MLPLETKRYILVKTTEFLFCYLLPRHNHKRNLKKFTIFSNEQQNLKKLDQVDQRYSVVLLLTPEVYSEPCQTSKMGCFGKTANVLAISAKHSFSDVSQGSELRLWTRLFINSFRLIYSLKAFSCEFLYCKEHTERC